MPTAEKQVRVFISSTFRDMHAERDHLVTVVFPELRERVERLGLEFFDVDLRWGVPEKNADGEKANSWEYCRQWIDRVEPFFVCILGQRYGWVPEVKDFKGDEDKARQEAEPRSITDLEVRHAVLDAQKKRRSYFYIRQAQAPATASEYVDPPPLANRLEHMKQEVRTCGRPVWDYPCEWTGSGFVGMEEFGRRVLDDLWSGVLRDVRYVSKDVWRQALGKDPDTDPSYTDESQPVPRELAEKIAALAKPEPKDPLDAEREQMEEFAATRLRWFQGRTEELQQLTDFINSTDEKSPRFATVVAAPGQGKSALLAKLSTFSFQPPTFLIAHFVGATERSASAHTLVERLLGELDRGGIEWPTEQQEGQEPKRDFNSLCLRLAQRLGDYAGERRIVILLDALNQLSDGHDLHWLPYRLGPSVRVIVSCVEDLAAKADSPERKVLRAIDIRQPPPLRVSLSELTPDNVRTIVEEYLHEYCKELDTPHVNAICAMPQARNPLYLLVMLNELRTLGGNDLNRIVPALIASMPQDHPNTVSLFRSVLQRLEEAEGFGKAAVQWWCLYLAHGRVGMASRELADLLARKLGADAAATALRIERGLRRYLLRRGPQLDFFHGQLRQAVFEQYGPQGEAGVVHSAIATYFRDLADPQRNQSWKGDTPRPFLEVVFHLAGAQRLDELCQTLCDLRFVEARCRMVQVFELIADYMLAQEKLPEAQENLSQKRERQARMARWTTEITEYSRQWSERRDRKARGEVVSEPEPLLPGSPAVCRVWPKEEIDVECRRIIENPTRLDRLQAFATFVEQECYPLLELGSRPGFAVQHAFNNAPRGPVHWAATQAIPIIGVPLLMRHWFVGDSYNPRPALLRTLEGHSHSVTGVRVMPDGLRAVSGSADRTLRVWDPEIGMCLRIAEGNTSFVTDVCVTQDGLRAVSASDDSTLRVWDLEKGSCLNVLEGHSGWIWCVDITPDGRRVVSACGDDPDPMGFKMGRDRTLRVWDLETGTCLYVLEGHERSVTGVCVTPDGRRAISASADKTLRVWDLETGVCSRVLEGHTEKVFGVSVTADGRRAVSVGADETLRVWDLDLGICQHVLKGHFWEVHRVTVTPDGRQAISASWDKTLRVWDLEDGACLRLLEGHTNVVSGVSMTPDGRLAISASADKTLRVWDLESGIPLQVSDRHTKAVNRLCVTPDGRRAISASADTTLREWDLETGKCLHLLEGHTSWVSTLCVTPDGRCAVSAGDGFHDKTLRVWDLETGACLRLMEGHTDYISDLSVTPEGLRAVSASKDGTLRVWDMETGACLRILEGHAERFWRVCVTPDGRAALSVCQASEGWRLRLWDLATGKCLRLMEGHTDSISDLSVTPDGLRAVSASRDGTLRVWDLATGLCLQALKGHTDGVRLVSVMQNGRRAVSVSNDLTLRVWDIETGACLRVLKGHKDWVNCVSVTPDGRRAISASQDRTLRAWDLATGMCLAVGRFSAAPETVALSAVLCRTIAATDVGEVTQFDLREPTFAAQSQIPEGQDPEAQIRHEIAACLRLWGASHLNTLLAKLGLAATLEQTGKRNEAVEIRRDAARICLSLHADALTTVWEVIDQLAVLQEIAEEPEIRRKLDALRQEQQNVEKERRLARMQDAEKRVFRGDYSGAEGLLRGLLHEKFEVLSTRCLLAQVLLMTHRADQAKMEFNPAWHEFLEAAVNYSHLGYSVAWSTLLERNSIVASRILLLKCMFSMMGGGVSEGYIVAHMKNALRLPTAHAEWNIQPAVDRLRSSLGETNYQFLKALAEAVNDASAMPHLDEFSQWRNAPECASD